MQIFHVQHTVYGPDFHTWANFMTTLPEECLVKAYFYPVRVICSRFVRPKSFMVEPDDNCCDQIGRWFYSNTCTSVLLYILLFN